MLDFPQASKEIRGWRSAVLPGINEDDMVTIFSVSLHANGISIGTNSEVFVVKDKKHARDIFVAANA